jgi:hypothetical protein
MNLPNADEVILRFEHGPYDKCILTIAETRAIIAELRKVRSALRLAYDELRDHGIDEPADAIESALPSELKKSSGPLKRARPKNLSSLGGSLLPSPPSRR